MKKFIFTVCFILIASTSFATDITLSTPITEPAVTTARFAGMMWDVPSQQLVVTISLGYLDANGNFVEKKRMDHAVSKATYAELGTVTVQYGGKSYSLLELLDTVVVQKLVQKGVVNGTVK